MKALIKIILMLILVQPFAFASFDCYDSFVQSNSIIDNKSFELSDVDMNADFENSPELLMKEAIVKVISGVNACQDLAADISMAKSDDVVSVKCQEIVPGKSHSRVCFAESPIGYFFLKSDMLGNLDLNYNRWD
ncbi:hypothetical protein [Bacteriovorax sp. Seq25_V]|uniref:hypothetical protein n=1 Tax=Bacteriovorax sp. Seq25_V TaxID=1201288 RepID=UPI00038A2D4E|nr:hypothetical protein [Bacteriovorax sp. Seq25_V]EQC46161.1 hypothetical protein M900_1755 [Bacteriovorax sp. Seq25_V]